MPQKIILDNKPFTLIHRTNKRIKRISLSLQNNSEIVLKTPLGIKAHLIKSIIFEHKDWILRTTEKLPRKNKFDFITGGKVPYLGILYPIELKINDNIKTVKFTLIDNYFLIEHNSSCSSYEEFIKGLELFYKYNAKKIIDPLFDEMSSLVNLYPNKIGYRKAKTRWGSCSGINNISINYMLLQFDIKAIKYVVLHELCHIKHKNHSKKFWDLVSFYMQDYKTVQQTIKNKF